MRIEEQKFNAMDIFEKLGECKSELPEKYLGFICQLIKENRPAKILEIGVSGGGTTCAILNCLDKLELHSEMYSVDISYSYHYDPSKECGYQIKDAAPYLKSINRHHLLLGRNIAEVLPEIIQGEKFDMLILDTIHYLPGELLDFLVCFPYLDDDAIVVLDDIIFAHTGENINAIATRVLFDCVVADKILPECDGLPKLAAFQLNTDTKKYIFNCFSALSFPWGYDMDEQQLGAYRNIIVKEYSEELVYYFEKGIEINRQSLDKKRRVTKEIKSIMALCGEHDVLIYGAGQRGKALCSFLLDRGKHIEGFIISDDRNKEKMNCNIPVYHLSEINEQENRVILVAVADGEVIRNLKKSGLNFINTPNFIFPFIKQYYEILC